VGRQCLFGEVPVVSFMVVGVVVVVGGDGGDAVAGAGGGRVGEGFFVGHCGVAVLVAVLVLVHA
jgi:hypothetical protein